MEPADLLILGHVTRDEIGDQVRLGGAAGFTARAAAAFGLRAALVTVAPPEAPLLAELHGLEGLTLHVVPCETITTFMLDYAGPRRRLILRAAAAPLRPADIPAPFRAIPVVYVGPVAGECDRALVESLDPRAFVCAGLQGWLRRADGQGCIEPELRPEVRDPPRNLRAAVLSEEDHPECEQIAAHLAAAGVVVALTRGARGATLFVAGQRLDVPAAPARETDPTGAGDVFGLVFGIALARNASPQEAATLAALAAARVVEGPGLGTLTRTTIDLSEPRRG